MRKFLNIINWLGNNQSFKEIPVRCPFDMFAINLQAPGIFSSLIGELLLHIIILVSPNGLMMCTDHGVGHICPRPGTDGYAKFSFFSYLMIQHYNSVIKELKYFS